MPRPPRLLLSQSYYHIMTRGNNRNTVFRKEEDYHYFFSLMRKYKKDLPFDLYHYCLMSNHTHFLIRTKRARDFSLFMKKLNLAYFYYYKKHYGWIGHFWQDRFKSQPVGKDAYFMQCGKYIELNPVRAGVVKNPKDYPYSSYRYYVEGEQNDLITEDFFYHELGKNVSERQERYNELVIGQVVVESYKNNIWGSPGQRYNERKKITHHLRKRKDWH